MRKFDKFSQKNTILENWSLKKENWRSKKRKNLVGKVCFDQQKMLK